MFSFTLKQTDEYERLKDFMTSFGLEFTEGEEKEAVKCWETVQDPDYLVGGIILSQRKGEYVIGGIAVDPPVRHMGVGRIMMDKAVKEVKDMGGSRIYLVAKVPEFFRTLGFETVDPEDAPDIFTCKDCRQFGDTCNPEIMKLEI